MSAMETRMDDRRAAARNAAERRKKMILVGLAVVLVALLAFELPKLLNRSSSSSSTAATSVTTLATPATASNAPTRTLAMVSVSAKRTRAILRLAPKNPFVPLIKDSASTSSPASGAPASARPATRVTRLLIAPANTKPAVVKPARVKPAAPTAAVIRTNGKRQVVGLSQVFNVGDVRLRLAAVTRKAIRIKVLGGLFAGNKQSITVRKGHGVKLANTATGVTYQLRFTAGTTAAPTVTQSGTQPSQSTLPNAAHRPALQPTANSQKGT